jgi:leucyl aminopeptidase (aminopeptidase T)
MRVMNIEYMKPAKFTIEKIFEVKPSENVLIIADTNKLEFVYPFMAASYAVGAEPIAMIITPRDHPGEPLPKEVNAAIRAADVVIGCVTMSIAIQLVKNIREDASCQVRGASISNITRSVMMSGGLWADPNVVMEITNEVYKIASRAKSWRLTTKAGTDLRAEIRDCRIAEKLPMIEPRMVGVLPGCEVAIDPKLGTAEGIFYSDGSCGALTEERLGYKGIISDPIKCLVKNGKIIDIEGGKEAKIFQDILQRIGDQSVYMINHLAIGCNPNCKMTGDYINDEKIFAGVHIANAGVKGCPIGNIDHCLQRPSLWLDGEKVIENWKFVGQMAKLQKIVE